MASLGYRALINFRDLLQLLKKADTYLNPLKTLVNKQKKCFSEFNLQFVYRIFSKKRKREKTIKFEKICSNKLPYALDFKL